MCGDSSRQSEGGAIAILQTINQIHQPQHTTNSELRFHTDHNTLYANRISYTSRDAGIPTDFFVVIHKQGDMTKPINAAEYLHKLHFLPSSVDSSGTRSLKLDNPLQISPGGEGVIGRRVLLYESSGQSPLAEGLIGWN
ncbi:hypothetical protein BT63DRAFT_239993 [Microthyrium microscopicum]|uniref:Uncharacterized protein n=1 Tax=Microthyrium microscopicum TaxID=703497 RepID=A0A6A6UEB7_9PEZI|nr:hypothetical protein BT63DRAFT_239993 [Microthyrium microscopicum]